MKGLALICLVGLAAASASAFGQDYVIYPAGPQDGVIWVGGVDGVNLPYGFWGAVNGTPFVQAGIHTLPAVAAAQILSAELRIPETDNLWTGNGAEVLSIDWNVQHFDASDDNGISAGDFGQPSLAPLGLYRAAGPQSINGARYSSLDVTAAVKEDLMNGRASFAWRLWPGADLPVANAQMYFPTVENVDGYFGADNHGARLLITLPEPASAGLLLVGVAGLIVRRRA